MRKHILFVFIFFMLFALNYNYIYGKFDSISEESGIVLDADSSAIIYNKNINKKIFPASTTKILTAILAIENLNLDANITVTDEALANVPTESSIMYLKSGEILTVRQLLYGLLLPSGSDAANVLAIAVSGSLTNFSHLMNDKLKQLNCIDSHFTNPHGFHDNNHYSTAYDMALIMKYASQNETFRTICETKEYIIEATNKTLAERKLENTNTLLSNKLDYILGGKTGYTDEAGNVFICYSRFNEKNIICCVFDGIKNILSKKTRFIDAKMLIDNSFKDFDKVKILDKGEINISYIDKKTNTNYILGIDNDVYCLADKNPYLTDYTFSDISIKEGVITGKLYLHTENDNWVFNDTYELKLTDKTHYSNKETNKSEIKLYILVILIVLVMILSHKKNKYIKKGKVLKRRKY